MPMMRARANLMFIISTGATRLPSAALHAFYKNLIFREGNA
jgi:hypothetical protein